MNEWVAIEAFERFRRGDNRADGEDPSPESLAHEEHVRRYMFRIHSPPCAKPTQACLNSVDDEKRSVATRDLSGAGKIPGGWNSYATLSLYGLYDEHGWALVGSEGLLERVKIIERHVADIGQERFEWILELPIAGGTKCAHRLAVITPCRRDNSLSPLESAKLERCLNSFSARARKVGVLKIRWTGFSEQRGRLRQKRIHEQTGGDRMSMELLHRSSNNFWMAMPEDEYSESPAIEIRLVICCEDQWA